MVGVKIVFNMINFRDNPIPDHILLSKKSEGSVNREGLYLNNFLYLSVS